MEKKKKLGRYIAFAIAFILLCGFSQNALAYTDDSDVYDSESTLSNLPKIKYVKEMGSSFTLQSGSYGKTHIAFAYESSDNSLLTVDRNGKVTVAGDISGYREHQKIGTIKIKAIAGPNQSFENGQCEVFKGIPVESITVSPNMPKTIKVGQAFNITDYIQVEPANASLPLLEFSPVYRDKNENKQNQSIVDFNHKGRVRGISPGKMSVLIYPTDGGGNDGIYTETALTVTGNTLEKFSAKKKIALKVGETYTLKPAFFPPNASNKRFTYSYSRRNKNNSSTESGLKIKGKQTTSSVNANTFYGLDKTQLKTLLRNISYQSLITAFDSAALKELLYASGVGAKKVDDIPDIAAYYKTVNLSKLADKLNFEKLCGGGIYAEENSEYQSDKSIVITAKKAGTYELYLTAEGGDGSSQTVVITVKKTAGGTQKQTPSAQTGDHKDIFLFHCLLFISVAAAIAVKINLYKFVRKNHGKN